MLHNVARSRDARRLSPKPEERSSARQRSRVLLENMSDRLTDGVEGGSGSRDVAGSEKGDDFVKTPCGLAQKNK